MYDKRSNKNNKTNTTSTEIVSSQLVGSYWCQMAHRVVSGFSSLGLEVILRETNVNVVLLLLLLLSFVFTVPLA